MVLRSIPRSPYSYADASSMKRMTLAKYCCYYIRSIIFLSNIHQLRCFILPSSLTISSPIFPFTQRPISIRSVQNKFTTRRLTNLTKLLHSMSGSGNISGAETVQKLQKFSSLEECMQYVQKAALAIEGRDNIRKCGRLACQYDSLLQSLDSSSLVSFASFDGDDTDANTNKKTGKKKNKKKDASSSCGGSSNKNNHHRDSSSNNENDSYDKRTRYTIVLTDSVFFPEGGGQPSDQGIITFTVSNSICIDGNKNVREEEQLKLFVIDVQNVKGTCIMTCLAPKDMSPMNVLDILQQHQTYQRIERQQQQNQQPERCFTIRQNIDWDKRFDHMIQHSAQHLLSAIALNDPFYIPTASWSFGKDDTSYIDFHMNNVYNHCASEESDTELKNEKKVVTVDSDKFYKQMKKVERFANQCIRENFAMTPRWIDSNSLEFQSSVRSRLLPKGLTGEIRLVEIRRKNIESESTTGTAKLSSSLPAILDSNTCCGTHTPNLSQLQHIQLTKFEKVKPTLMRVYYAAGERRISSLLEGALERQNIFTSLLSCTEDDHVSRLEQVLEDKREKEREVRILREELCDLRATEIVRQCCSDDGNGVAVVDLSSSSAGGVDMNYMMMMSNAVLKKINDNENNTDAIVENGRDVLLLFVMTTSNGESEFSSDEGSFLLTGNNAKLVDCIGKEIAKTLSGRGGGKNGRFQGKGTKIKSRLSAAKDLLSDVINHT